MFQASIHNMYYMYISVESVILKGKGRGTGLSACLLVQLGADSNHSITHLSASDAVGHKTNITCGCLCQIKEASAHAVISLCWCQSTVKTYFCLCVAWVA
jgi:hypothetical protein